MAWSCERISHQCSLLIGFIMIRVCNPYFICALDICPSSLCVSNEKIYVPWLVCTVLLVRWVSFAQLKVYIVVCLFSFDFQPYGRSKTAINRLAEICSLENLNLKFVHVSIEVTLQQDSTS